MNLLHLTAPEGTEWELLVAVVVIIVAPWLAERVHVPGLIGLLVGGMIIGPNVLDVVQSSSGIVKELGDVGLLYLMFMAGLDLDLAVFAALPQPRDRVRAHHVRDPDDVRAHQRLGARIRTQRLDPARLALRVAHAWCPTRPSAAWGSRPTGRSPPRSARP